MDRNLWLAIALSIGVYAVWFGFVDKRVDPAPARPAAAGAPAVPGAPPSAARAAAPAAASAPSADAVATERDAQKVIERSEPVLLDGAQARVSPDGAAIASFLFPGPLSRIELVEDAAHGLFATWPGLRFRRDPKAKDPVFVAVGPGGVRLTKEFSPGEGTVLPRLVITATNPTARPLTVAPWTLTLGPGLGTIKTELKENHKVLRVIGLTPEGGGLKGRVEKLKPGEHPGPYRWVALDNRYFLAAVLPSAEQFGPAVTSDPPALTLTAKAVTLAPHGSFTWSLPYYLGPKGQSWLSHYGVGLERAIDFGFFAQLGRWMLTALVKLHAVIGNWGWAIIALTLLLQVVMGPLTYKSLKSAASMRKLQPEIAKLQARYKEDPTRLNSEMMALYKKGGANPLGGCLPMILQMPIFLALYNALRGSWELHGSAWIFWIHDLSAKDPYYVLPLVMGGLMFLQSKMNPPTADPTQQQMMMFMPVIFTFMFLNFPSGLVLYWLTNSLVSTLIQVALKSRLDAAA